jgi:predicted transglutaminase-like cysteine proteinase
MKHFHDILRLGLLTAGLCATGQAGAQTLAALPDPSLEARIVGQARPVLAWAKLCERLPAECEVDTTEPATIALTAKAWQAIVSVNRRVNTTVRPLTDNDHWGVPDSWDFPTDGAGDCEDYQLQKRKLLVEAGLPRRAMRMTVVIDAEGDGHAVLTVRTDAGDLILDNKRDAVLAWNETGYEFIKREGSDTKAWVALGGEPARTVVASRSVRKAAAGPARR